MIKFPVRDWRSNEIKFTAEIDCDESESYETKLGLAAIWGYENDEDLTFADLRGAYLSFDDLRDADLYCAYLSEAYLSEADIRDSDIRGAYLYRAAVTGANLTDADLRFIDLTNPNLTDAKGLKND